MDISASRADYFIPSEMAPDSGVIEEVVWGVQTPPPRNSEVLKKLNRIANWAENV